MNIMTDALSVASALAHLTRLHMLDELRIETCTFDDLKDKLNQSGNVVNFHLRILERVELVTKIGAVYTLTDFGRTTFENLIRNAEERLEKQGIEK